MSLIQNILLKNKNLATSFGMFTFDDKGIADIPKEQADKLLQLKGYTCLDESPQVTKTPEVPTMTTPEIDGDNSEKKEQVTTIEELNSKNVPMLKKFAKEQNINTEGLSTKTELVDAIVAAMNLK